VRLSIDVLPRHPWLGPNAGVSSDKHVRVALVLMLLGKVYARTARVMFAEGMYRESAKLMRLDPSKVDFRYINQHI